MGARTGQPAVMGPSYAWVSEAMSAQIWTPSELWCHSSESWPEKYIYQRPKEKVNAISHISFIYLSIVSVFVDDTYYCVHFVCYCTPQQMHNINVLLSTKCCLHFGQNNPINQNKRSLLQTGAGPEVNWYLSVRRRSSTRSKRHSLWLACMMMAHCDLQLIQL